VQQAGVCLREIWVSRVVGVSHTGGCLGARAVQSPAAFAGLEWLLGCVDPVDARPTAAAAAAVPPLVAVAAAVVAADVDWHVSRLPNCLLLLA